MPRAIEAESTVSPLYAQAAGRLKALIDNGTLEAGERLPSVREYARLQDIAVNTVLRAYRILEDDGYLETRPQSGHFVRSRPVPKEPPGELRLPEVQTRIHAVDVDSLVARVFGAVNKPSIIGLGAACPPGSLMPWRELNRHMVAATRAGGPDVHDYQLPPGYPPLLHQLARRSMAWGCALTPRDILVTAGCGEALSLSLRAVAKAGDIIAVESPTYFGLLQMIEHLGMKVLEIPVHPRHGLSLDALEEALKHVPIRTCVATPNFQNPVGSLMPDADKERLVRMLSKAGVPLIEDDIFGDLPFEGRRPRTAKSFDKDGNVLLCSSFSKTLSPGYRVGWVAAGRFHERVVRLKSTTTMGAAAPSQRALSAYLEGGGYEHHVRKLRGQFTGLTMRYREAVVEAFPQGTRVSRPQGGHVLWVEMPEGSDALALFDKAMKKGVSVAPGPIFSASGKFRNFVRLNCGVMWEEKVAEAVRMLGRLAREARQG